MANIDTASRLSSATGCALKYQYQYVHKVPQRDGGSLILGNVVHDSMQAWWELPDSERQVPGKLWSIFQAQWKAKCPPGLFRRLQAELAAQDKVDAIASAIALTRPKLVAPANTKDYKESPEAQELSYCGARTRDWLDANENEIRWSRSEPPLRTWMLSRGIAERMEADWIHRPRPFLVERSFTVEHDGFQWRGRIDVYGPMDDDGVMEPTLIDWKSGQPNMSPQEFFIQGTIYHLAMAELGLPIERVLFVMVRTGQVHAVRIRPEEHYKRLTQMRRSMELVLNEQGLYVPSYSFACRNCDYRSLCAEDLSLIESEETAAA